MLHPTFAIRVPHKESQMIHSTQQLSGSALSASPQTIGRDVNSPGIRRSLSANREAGNSLKQREPCAIWRWYSPPVHMIKLTQQREIAPYAWVHPDHDDRR
jgi:hypothetical protein